MSQENVEIVRHVYEAFNRRDWDSVLVEHAHENFELTTQRDADLSGTLRGGVSQ